MDFWETARWYFIVIVSFYCPKSTENRTAMIVTHVHCCVSVSYCQEKEKNSVASKSSPATVHCSSLNTKSHGPSTVFMHINIFFEDQQHLTRLMDVQLFVCFFILETINKYMVINKSAGVQ